MIDLYICILKIRTEGDVHSHKWRSKTRCLEELGQLFSCTAQASRVAASKLGFFSTIIEK